jgi:Ca2+:H+ antiporter
LKIPSSLPVWSIAADALGPIAQLATGWRAALLAAGLMGGVLAAVFHAEVVAHRVGEPYGTLVLAPAAPPSCRARCTW